MSDPTTTARGAVDALDEYLAHKQDRQCGCPLDDATCSRSRDERELRDNLIDWLARLGRNR